MCVVVPVNANDVHNLMKRIQREIKSERMEDRCM